MSATVILGLVVVGVVGSLLGLAIRYARSSAKAEAHTESAEESERAKDDHAKSEARYRGGLGDRARRLLDERKR